MAVRPLSPEQHALIDALVAARRIEDAPADATRKSTFLQEAEERIGEFERIESAVVLFGVAYDAAHDVGEALLAAYGYRTRSGAGQHEALGRFLAAVLTTPPGDRAARQFDRLRRARNRDRYDARPVARADADRAVRAARELLAAALEIGAGE